MYKKVCLTLFFAGLILAADAQELRPGRLCGSSDTVSIRFRINESQVDKSYAENDNQLRLLDSMLTTGRVDSVIVLATASPDGRQTFNKSLAEKRAETIALYIDTLLGGGKNI